MKTKSKKINCEFLRELIRCDAVSVRLGVYTARRGFFYRNSSAAQFREWVECALQLGGIAAIIDDCGEIWKDFDGGASVAKSSHWWVTFTVTGETK